MGKVMGEKGQVRGRFAPSPSGRMHLGNVTAALLSWLSVRSQQGSWVLRIEDLDPQRSRRAFAEQIMDDLRWLGLDWDETPLWQSERTAIYEEKLGELQKKNLIYPCHCSRADLHSASAPHGTDGELLYSGRCRNLSEQEKRTLEKTRRPAMRVRVDNRVIALKDGLQGQGVSRLDQTCGDFIVRRSDGVFAYQLAVVIDDGLTGITEVVRGMDLVIVDPSPDLSLSMSWPACPRVLPHSLVDERTRAAVIQTGSGAGSGRAAPTLECAGADREAGLADGTARSL